MKINANNLFYSKGVHPAILYKNRFNHKFNPPTGGAWINLGDLITEKEAISLIDFVSKNKEKSNSSHNIIMKWLDNHKKVTDRFLKHGVVKSYGAYIFEHYLEI